jgi:hypothetical protein
MKTLIPIVSILIFLVSCNKEIKVETENSRFTLEIPDTLKIGNNYGRIKDYSIIPKKDDINLLSVIIENEYENNKARKDTFSDGTLTPFFKILRNKKGKQFVKLSIEEKILSETRINSDSTNLRIVTNEYFYTLEFIVMGENFKSNFSEKLIKEMNLKYEKQLLTTTVIIHCGIVTEMKLRTIFKL